LDAKLRRLTVGLAIESALDQGFDVVALGGLYSDPDEAGIRELHGRLITSVDHRDREVAIWLEPALGADSLKSDPAKLAGEMREMEFILLTLARRAGVAQQEINAWMNYVANAAQFIVDGFWIDAKILLSRALMSSGTPAVEALKADPDLLYEVDVLQRATSAYFDELRGYPVSIRVPTERLNAALDLQGIMIDLMRSGELGGEEGRKVKETVHGLSSVLHHLMGSRETPEEIRKELGVVASRINWFLPSIANEGRRALLEGYRRTIEALASRL
jgi:hypothetical protein